MNPGKFNNSKINSNEMSAVRGGNDEPIREPENILIVPPPKKAE